VHCGVRIYDELAREYSLDRSAEQKTRLAGGFVVVISWLLLAAACEGETGEAQAQKGESARLPSTSRHSRPPRTRRKADQLPTLSSTNPFFSATSILHVNRADTNVCEYRNDTCLFHSARPGDRCPRSRLLYLRALARRHLLRPHGVPLACCASGHWAA